MKVSRSMGVPTEAGIQPSCSGYDRRASTHFQQSLQNTSSATVVITDSGAIFGDHHLKSFDEYLERDGSPNRGGPGASVSHSQQARLAADTQHKALHEGKCSADSHCESRHQRSSFELCPLFSGEDQPQMSSVLGTNLDFEDDH